MQVSKIIVTKLFGTFDHEISLESQNRVTIIHGPNGIGKTVLLKMIEALIEGTTAVFERTPFEEFRVVLANDSAAVVRHHVEEDASGKSSKKLDFSFIAESGEVTSVASSTAPANAPRSILARVDQYVPGPYRLSGNFWSDDSGNRYSLMEIVAKFPRAADVLPRKYRPGIMFDAFSETDVFFVETDRLGGHSSKLHDGQEAQAERERWAGLTHSPSSASLEPTRRVKKYSRDIGRRIQAVLAAYARKSQERDRTFPERLVRFVREGHEALPPRNILDQMLELEKKRQRLILLGLLDKESGIHDLTEEDVRRAPEALTIYVSDVQEKLMAFDHMEQTIGTLIDIINDRFKYKHIVVDRDHGFRVVGDAGNYIEVGDLSSGEQHEIVVLYELLFMAPPKGLWLVDEPEISLHVGWQSRFLADLMKILELTDAHAIVATHSPVIIGTRWDLAIELKGPGTPD